MSRVEWNGPGAQVYIRSRIARVLYRAAAEVAREAKRLLSVPGTAVSLGSSGQRRGSRIEGASRSRPGEPPRKQTGRLRASVTQEVDEAAGDARVGTNVAYGLYLELGTRHGLEPRPWLRPALANMRGRVDQILAGLGE